MKFYRMLTAALTLALLLTALSLSSCDRLGGLHPAPEKPVIYLYPEEPTEVNVKLTFAGTLTETIPAYPQDGWTVIAAPDGTLTDANGQSYPYLFWEGVADGYLAGFTEGFCIKGSETEGFLTEILTGMGLNQQETADFLAYWLPRMEKNPYNLIRFCGEDYTDMAELTVTPAPDSVLRVFMMFEASDEYRELPAQVFEPFERKGFTVVEWGGCEIK